METATWNSTGDDGWAGWPAAFDSRAEGESPRDMRTMFVAYSVLIVAGLTVFLVVGLVGLR